MPEVKQAAEWSMPEVKRDEWSMPEVKQEAE
jgi:hypothetical protein